MIIEMHSIVPCSDWERGYEAGYARALKHMTLVGCICHDCPEGERGECPICETAEKLRKSVLNAS